MDLHLTVDLKKTKTLIDLADQAHLIIEQTTKLPKKEAAILFLLRDNQLVALGLAEEKATYKEVSFDHSILLKPTWDTELAYLAQAFLDDAKESGLTLEATPATVKIPKSAVATVTNYKETVTFILERFGYSLFKKPAPKKARPAKARHKWTKEVKRVQGKLSNERFVSNAPDEVVEAERAKEKDYLEKQEAVKERIAQLRSI